MIITRDPNGGAIGHNITDFPDFTGLFDQMRCSGVSIKFMPSLPPGTRTDDVAYAPIFITFDRDGLESQYLNITPGTVIQQIDQVKTRNAYRPFKIYRSAVKSRINTNIPTIYPANQGGVFDGVTYPQVILPNQNLAGRWLNVTRVGGSSATLPYVSDTFHSTGQRGIHLSICTDTTILNTEDIPQLGQFIITTYHTFKDRR